MSYKITIEHNSNITQTTRGQYCVIGKDEDGESEYGYPPSYDEIVEKGITVYEQTVEELDVGSVIKAVNKMEEK